MSPGEGDRVAVQRSPGAIGELGMDRMSSEYSWSQNKAARPATFEETYPRYEFAEMVRIGLVLAEWLVVGAGWLATMRRRVRGPGQGMPSSPSPREMSPAE